MRTITVEASASVFCSPDRVRITLVLSGIKDGCNEAVSAAADRYDALINALKANGICETLPKTASYTVGPKREFHEQKSVLVGYEYRHSLHITCDIADHKTLGGVLEAIQSIEAVSDSELSYEVNYELGDRETRKNEAVALAVKTAKAKAELIAEAANVKLADIVSIKYEDHGGGVMLMRAMPTNDIVPEDIEIRENVSVEWEIM